VVTAALATSLSGPLASYGRAGAAALELWAQWHRVELTVYDAHPDPGAAIAEAERRRPDLLFGPYGSSPTAAAAAATSRLLFNHGGARTRARENLVSVLAPAETYFVGAVEVVHLADPAPEAVCLMHGETGFGRAVADGAAAAAAAAGIAVHRTALPAGAALHAPLADGHEGALLLVAGGFADELAVARRMVGAPWRAAGFVGAGVAEVLAPLGARREGLLGPCQWLASAAPVPDEGPTVSEFAAAYRRRTGAEPPYPAAQAFAAGLIAGRCLREAGAPEDAALAAAARALDCTTLYGQFRLDASGRQVGHQVLTVQWQDGERRVVWPADRAQAQLRHPRRPT